MRRERSGEGGKGGERDRRVHEVLSKRSMGGTRDDRSRGILRLQVLIESWMKGRRMRDRLALHALLLLLDEIRVLHLRSSDA